MTTNFLDNNVQYLLLEMEEWAGCQTLVLGRYSDILLVGHRILSLTSVRITDSCEISSQIQGIRLIPINYLSVWFRIQVTEQYHTDTNWDETKSKSPSPFPAYYFAKSCLSWYIMCSVCKSRGLVLRQGCATNYTVKHILLDCVDFYQSRIKYFKAKEIGF